jgi:hypothetical protein
MPREHRYPGSFPATSARRAGRHVWIAGFGRIRTRDDRIPRYTQPFWPIVADIHLVDRVRFPEIVGYVTYFCSKVHTIWADCQPTISFVLTAWEVCVGEEDGRGA